MAYDDTAARGMSAILRRIRKLGARIYMSGSGSDEIISDYAKNGKPIFSQSSFNGIFPANLSSVFPWKNFFAGTMRDYIMKEELVGGAHGIETRYPFLDPAVVQEYLWLHQDVKNSMYKKPIDDFFTQHNFPFTKGVKKGFGFSRKNPSFEIKWSKVKAYWDMNVPWLTVKEVDSLTFKERNNATSLLVFSSRVGSCSCVKTILVVLLGVFIVAIASFRTLTKTSRWPPTPKRQLHTV